MVPRYQAKELYLIIKASQPKHISMTFTSTKNTQKPSCSIPENNTLVGYKNPVHVLKPEGKLHHLSWNAPHP